jgi:TRAP-type C4-dicarboxylate transport system permease small subunit
MGKPLIRFLQLSTSSLMVVLLAVLTWQVVSRYVLQDPSTVTEELSRLLLMWLGTLGTALGFMQRKHLSFDLLEEKATPRTRALMIEAVDVCVVLFGLLLLIGGALLVWEKASLGQTSPVLKIPYVYVSLVLPLAGLCISLSPFIGVDPPEKLD